MVTGNPHYRSGGLTESAAGAEGGGTAAAVAVCVVAAVSRAVVGDLSVRARSAGERSRRAVDELQCHLDNEELQAYACSSLDGSLT